jgi:choline dehydrogenase-like flavoprotein
MARATPGRKINFPRGKVTGGSSAVNGQVALRGTPQDFVEWAAWGNSEWSFEQVLPFHRKLEDDPRRARRFSRALLGTLREVEPATRGALLPSLFCSGTLNFNQNHARWLLPFIHGKVARSTRRNPRMDHSSHSHD